MKANVGKWVWVTTPDYYLDEDGNDCSDLDPSLQADSGGWWSCHRDTRQEDLILLYRTTPRKDLGYLLQAESDAYSLADDKHAALKGWGYGCDYQVLYKFQYPLTLDQIRSDPYLEDWSALRGNFQRLAYRIPEGVWQQLIDTIRRREREFDRFLKRGGIKRNVKRIVLEEELEYRIAEHPEILRPFGYDLEIVDRQLICVGHGGRIDLLAYDRKQKRHVVIELKNVKAGQNTFGQIATYLGWVDAHRPRRRKADGLVIARGFDNRFLSAAAITNRVQYLDLTELGFD